MTAIPPTDQDWQTGKSLQQCNLYMLENQIACDVTFLLGKDEKGVHAHKLILLSRSPVFYAMFCGPMAEKQSRIPIPDIEFKVFQELLSYIYSDKAIVDDSTVVSILYAAKKYAISGLIKVCSSFISQNINVQTACLFLHEVNHLDEPDLFRECLVYIQKNGKACLKSDAFCEIDKFCVEKVIEGDGLKATELSVWKGLVRWAEAECGRQAVAVNGPNLRQAMGDLVYSVRFLGITPDTLAKSITSEDILTAPEVAGLFRFCLKATESFGNFSVKKGRFESYCFRVIRLTDPSQSYDGFQLTRWPCDGERNEIEFAVSEPIVLCGVVLYGCGVSKSLYQISITLHNTQCTNSIQSGIGCLILSDNKTVETVSNGRTFDVIFSQDVKLKKEIYYRICVQVTGDNSYYGIKGKSSVTKENVTFYFRYIPAQYRTNQMRNATPGFNGDGVQIPGLIFHTDQ